MSESKSLQINDDLEWCAPAYIKAFLPAYWTYGVTYGATAQASIPHLKLYHQSIMDNLEAISKETADGISNYLNRYNVGTDETIDEYKIVYFLGRAILKYLPDFAVLKGVHMFAMVGLLDYRLQKRKIEKPQLVTALTSLIRSGQGVFDAELGLHGCYLIYKCVSTTPDHMVEAKSDASLPLRGTGLDAPALSATTRAVGGG